MTWTRIENDLVRKPEVVRLAKALGLTKPAVIGHLAIFWNWCVEQMDDTGRITTDDPEFVIDDVAMHDGFAAALAAVGWLVLEDDGALIPSPDRFMDFTKKKKAAQRARDYRARQRDEEAAEPDAEERNAHASVTGALRERDGSVTEAHGQRDVTPLDGDGDGEHPPPTPPGGSAAGGDDLRKQARELLDRDPNDAELAQLGDLLEYVAHPVDGKGIRSPDAFVKRKLGTDWSLPPDSKIAALRRDEARERKLLEDTRRRNRETDRRRESAISLSEYRSKAAAKA